MASNYKHGGAKGTGNPAAKRGRWSSTRTSSQVKSTGELRGGVRSGGEVTLAELAARPDAGPLIDAHLAARYDEIELGQMRDVSAGMEDVFNRVLAGIAVSLSVEDSTDWGDDFEALAAWIGDIFDSEAWEDLFLDQADDKLIAGLELGLGDTDVLKGVPDFLLMPSTIQRLFDNAQFAGLFPTSLSDKSAKSITDMLLLWYRNNVLDNPSSEINDHGWAYDVDPEGLVPNFVAASPIYTTRAMETYRSWVEGDAVEDDGETDKTTVEPPSEGELEKSSAPGATEGSTQKKKGGLVGLLVAAALAALPFLL